MTAMTNKNYKNKKPGLKEDWPLLYSPCEKFTPMFKLVSLLVYLLASIGLRGLLIPSDHLWIMCYET